MARSIMSVRLPDALCAALRKEADAQRTTLTEVIETALRAHLSREEDPHVDSF